jgi:hypothetical protein
MRVWKEATSTPISREEEEMAKLVRASTAAKVPRATSKQGHTPKTNNPIVYL